VTARELVNALMFYDRPDAEVVIDDADTRSMDDKPGWLLAIKRIQLLDGRLVLSGDYHDSQNPEKHG
jgi:hypothetical protein